MRTLQDLQMKQALPLNVKILLTKDRIRQWVNEFGEDGVYVSFSGGKDSTVLLHLVRELYPDVQGVFLDTGLEYPEIRDFVRTFDNIVWLKPKMNFRRVIEKYGYPFISKEVSAVIGGGQKSLEILAAEGIDITDRSEIVKQCQKRIRKDRGEWRRLAQCFSAITKDGEIKEHLQKEDKGMYSSIPKKYEYLLEAPFHISDRCCQEMKKNIAKKFHKETGKIPMTAQMASESRLRTRQWMKYGCNAFDAKHKVSNPMSFWKEQDVLLYIYQNHIPISSVYGDIIKDNEVDGQTDWSDLGLFDTGVPVLRTTGRNRTGCMFCGFGCHLEPEGQGRFEKMKVTHPKQYEWIMKPWADGGLGYKDVIDWINEHNGNGTIIRY